MPNLGNQHCASCIGTLSFPIKSTSWASAHRGKWGQLTPLEKLMKN